jgi:drug/metabolite transporter (DMT)-like permease
LKKSTRADLWFLFIVTLWGTSFPLVKGALPYVSPALFVVLRFLIAGPIWFVLYRKTLKDMKPGTFWRGIVLGAVLGLGFVFQTAGLGITSASMSAFITGLNVVVVPLLVVGIERRLPRVTSLIGVLLCAVGLYVMTAPGGEGLNTGDLLTIGCAVLFGLYIVLVEVFTIEHDPRPISLIQTLGVLIVAVPAIPLIETPFVEFTFAFAWRWIALGTMAALTIGLQLYWQRYITATRAAIIFALEPVFAAVFSFFILGELLSVAAYIGGAIIVSGMVVAETGARVGHGVDGDGIGR